MEMKLSKFYWRNLYGFLLLGVIVEVLLGYMYLGDTSEDLLTGMLLMIGCLCVCICDVFTTEIFIKDKNKREKDMFIFIW